MEEDRSYPWFILILLIGSYLVRALAWRRKRAQEREERVDLQSNQKPTQPSHPALPKKSATKKAPIAPPIEAVKKETLAVQKRAALPKHPAKQRKSRSVKTLVRNLRSDRELVLLAEVLRRRY